MLDVPMIDCPGCSLLQPYFVSNWNVISKNLDTVWPMSYNLDKKQDETSPRLISPPGASAANHESINRSAIKK
jgi:hypothetical protein